MNINIYNTHNNNNQQTMKEKHAIVKNASKRKQFLELPSVSSNSYPSMMILIDILYEIQKQRKHVK